MMDHQEQLKKRKEDHIRIVLEREVTGKMTTGLEAYRFVPLALPEIDFASISLGTSFSPSGKKMKTPFLISSMTGGTLHGERINRNLAIAAEQQGWAMGLGSLRIVLEDPSVLSTFQVRKYAPSIPLIANLGAVQLNYGATVEDCQRIVELVEADALVLHLNSLQEVFQPEGNTNFHGLLSKIETLCRSLSVPVGVKEVGFGIAWDVAKRLAEAGVKFIDVAGAGGTSWIQVEKYRNPNPIFQRAAEAFADWGIPTADSLVEVRRAVSNAFVIASGGLHSGVDAAKTLALGADLIGFGRTLLQAAVDSTPEQIIEQMRQIELELKIAMFGIGVRTIEELRTTNRLVKRD